MKNTNILKKIIFTGIFLLICFSVSAQDLSVRIEMIESRNFPKVEAIINVEESTGEPVLSIVKANVKARVDLDKEIEKIDIIRFAQTDRPTHFYVLITNSGLTKGQPLAMQKEAILRILDLMAKNDTISVYTIGPEPIPVVEDTDKESFDLALLTELGITEKQSKIFDSLVGLNRVIKDDQEKRAASKSRSVILLLTDGRDQESRATFEEVTSDFVDSGFPVYSIGIRILGSQKLSTVNTLSNTTGGYYYFSRDMEKVPDIMEELHKKILNAYLLSFKVKGIPADDDRHQLMINVTDREITGDAFKSFYAIKVPVPVWLQVLLIILAILLFVAFIVFTILSRRKERKSMGIGKRRCDDCGRRLMDDWEFCPFCRYLKKDKKRKKKKKKDKNKKEGTGK